MSVSSSEVARKSTETKRKKSSEYSCEEFKQLCDSDEYFVTAEDWCDIDPREYLGPGDLEANSKCHALGTLIQSWQAGLATRVYNVKSPQWPNDPFNRVLVSIPAFLRYTGEYEVLGNELPPLVAKLKTDLESEEGHDFWSEFKFTPDNIKDQEEVKEIELNISANLAAILFGEGEGDDYGEEGDDDDDEAREGEIDNGDDISHMVNNFFILFSTWMFNNNMILDGVLDENQFSAYMRTQRQVLDNLVNDQEIWLLLRDLPIDGTEEDRDEWINEWTDLIKDRYHRLFEQLGIPILQSEERPESNIRSWAEEAFHIAIEDEEIPYYLDQHIIRFADEILDRITPELSDYLPGNLSGNYRIFVRSLFDSIRVDEDDPEHLSININDLVANIPGLMRGTALKRRLGEILREIRE